jgi:hypothetical protein
VDIEIYMYDYDGEDGIYSLMIISGSEDGDVDVTYDLSNATWTGEDDHLQDRNGLGHTSGFEGYDDDTWTAFYFMGDIWFDIYQTDKDDDRIPFLQEVALKNADPELNDFSRWTPDLDPWVADYDTDSDGMDDWWEIRYGLDREDPNDATLDKDKDHHDTLTEFQLGSNPILFEVNLLVSMNWDAPDSYIDRFRRGMMGASKFLFDATDGYMYFRYIEIFDKVNDYDPPFWDKADIRVYQGSDQGFEAHIGGYYNGPESNCIKVPEFYDWGNDGTLEYPENELYYKAIIHEWGHYGLTCWDEYKDANGNYYPWRTDDPKVTEGPDSVMHAEYRWSELTTEVTYQNWVSPNGITTEHRFRTGGESCWETFFWLYRDLIWFDLDDDNHRDVAYDTSYEAKVGPEIYGNDYAGYCKFLDDFARDEIGA